MSSQSDLNGHWFGADARTGDLHKDPTVDLHNVQAGLRLELVNELREIALELLAKSLSLGNGDGDHHAHELLAFACAAPRP